MIDDIKFGWRKQLPDPRDKVFVPKIQIPKELLSVDLSKTLKIPPVMNQLTIGSCTGHGVGSISHFDLLNNHRNINFQPSRLFIYYNGRKIEGTESQDAGANIRDVIKGVAQYGFCDENYWAYDTLEYAKQPTPLAYQEALKFRAATYFSLDNTDKSNLVEALYNGFPFTLGITVFDSFQSNEVANTGIVPMPNFNYESSLGGHCVWCYGYDTNKDVFLCQNSWGTSWGNKGYFTIPGDYLTNPNLASDFWTINTLIKD